MAERLSFNTDDTPYNSMLAAEHLSRYALASTFCKGKRVLDIACGEGYGSAFLADSGAKSVLSVDISRESINIAKSIFSRPQISYIAADALDVNAWNPNNLKFDVIICFETIEHINKPEELIQIFSKIISSTGTIIISCPNDQVDNEYNQFNPFHFKTYSLNDFKKLTSKILGEAQQWLLATPVTGISIIDENTSQLSNDDTSIKQIFNTKRGNDALLIPAQKNQNVYPNNCSFYIGIWNGCSEGQTTIAPLSRKSYLESWYALLAAKKEREIALQNNQKLKNIIFNFEQRMETIRRIHSAELLNATKFNCNSKQEHNTYAAELEYYRTSRAHRVASLYTRSASGSNILIKLLQFTRAAISSAIRAIKRRLS